MPLQVIIQFSFPSKIITYGNVSKTLFKSNYEDY